MPKDVRQEAIKFLITAIKNLSMDKSFLEDGRKVGHSGSDIEMELLVIQIGIAALHALGVSQNELSKAVIERVFSSVTNFSSSSSVADIYGISKEDLDKMSDR